MTQVIATPISIELIHADPWEDLIGRAWTNSRPNVTSFEIHEVLKIDTPVSEMAGVVLHLTIPILFREIIASMRDHIMWARTSRVDNLTEVWPVIAEASEDVFLQIKQSAGAMAYDAMHGAGQDQFRQHLPLGYMTGLTMRFSIRSAVKLVGYFRQLNGEKTLQDAAADFARKLAVVLESLGLPLEELLATIKIPDYNPSPVVNTLTPRGGRIGNMLTISQIMPLSLRAQVIRHRTLTVIDNLSAYFTEPNVWAIKISDEMLVEISASAPTWREIVGKRNCWLAQADLWAPIVRQVAQLLHAEDGLLPCSNGVCPYAGDCQERLRGADPGLPCPRHINLTQAWETPEVAALMAGKDLCAELERYAIASKRPLHIWGQEIRLLRHQELRSVKS